MDQRAFRPGGGSMNYRKPECVVYIKKHSLAKSLKCVVGLMQNSG
jgi:hypothetical protein